MKMIDEQKFQQFVQDNYPNGETFLTHTSKREEFNRKNSQIVVNAIPVDMLFIGDSITEAFETNIYFREYGLIVNRGIGGEKLSELVKRFDADCLALRPRLAIVASGINDTSTLYYEMKKGKEITRVDENKLLEEMEQNYRFVLDKAQEIGVSVWLASVLPLGTSDFRTELILRINAAVQRLCEAYNTVYVDYHSALCKKDGKTLKDVHFGDDLHPHVKGYNIMYEVLKNLLEKHEIK